MTIRFACFFVIVVGMATSARAQIYQTDFPPEELRARCGRLMARIGEDAVAVVQGAPLANGFAVPRQSNSMYYLSGIETPGAYLVLDGRTKATVLYLPPRNERLERSEGRVLSAEDAGEVTRLTGADEVRSTAVMAGNWPFGEKRPAAIYAEFAPAEGYAQSRHEIEAADAAIAADYWDGRLPRQMQFVQLLRARHPRLEVRDLTPVLDDLRSVKSTREIALIRRASQLAGLGMIAAIRSTETGVYEYQLDAAMRYVFLLNGARLDAYRSITASGTENTDIGRVWPVSGRYLPWQRELLQFILEFRNVVLARIRPGVTSDQVLAEAREAMAPVLARTAFSKPIYEKAARRMLETGGGVLSHPVGMAVHDVGTYKRGILQPGHVFSVDPQLWVPEEHLYLRYEDTVVVTETGVENFTDFLPSELDGLEALVRERGLVQAFPADQPSPR